jgi:hypothetical protein
MVVAQKLVTALQRGRASTRWRDFADLFMLLLGDLVEPEIIEALRTVAEHRGVPLRPLGEVLEGMPQEVQGRWGAWRERQGAQDWVPENFATVEEFPVTAHPQQRPSPDPAEHAPIGRTPSP